jgi:hypothetical protein
MLTLLRKRIRRILLSVLSVDDKNDSDKDNKKIKILALVMWYLPVINRLNRVFSNPRDVKLVRWHSEKCRKNN